MAALPPSAPGPAPASAPTRERLLTWPLVVFLLAVGGAVAWGWLQRHPQLDLPAAIQLLGDGDLDGDERQQVLAGMLAAAPTAKDPAAKWAVLLAAVALEDRAAYAAMRAQLGGGMAPAEVPPPAARALLHLGDPLLGAVLAAGVAEAAGDADEARRCWQRVAAQGRLAGRAFPGDLAAAALARLAGK